MFEPQASDKAMEYCGLMYLAKAGQEAPSLEARAAGEPLLYKAHGSNVASTTRPPSTALLLFFWGRVSLLK